MALPNHASAQEDNRLPYRSIPEPPETYTGQSVAARMIDGLGFRYYWASEGLREEDLAYRLTPESRTSLETLDHIHGLCETVVNAVMQKPNIRPQEQTTRSFDELRMETLQMIKSASDQLKKMEAPALDDCQIVFQRGDQRAAFPFWNVLNGPLADAMWHVGQVVSMRRGSGNPISSKVNVFSGRLRE